MAWSTDGIWSGSTGGTAKTFGRTDVGLSNDSTGNTVVVGKKVTCPSAGTLTNISLYTKLGANGLMTAWLFSEDGANNHPKNKLATSTEIAVTTVAGWYNFPISYILAASDYHVAWSANQTHYHYFDVVANASWVHSPEVYPNCATPLTALHTHENKNISVHCDYIEF